MEININIPNELAYIIVILIALYVGDIILKLINKILDWRIRKLRQEKNSIK